MSIHPEDEKRSTAKLAQWLVGVTLVYNLIEAGIALAAGYSAESIALVGFGLDSIIEVSAASVLLWRLSLETRGADVATVEAAEHRVHRFVGWTFFALAAYVLTHAALSLGRHEEPAESTVGIVLATVSLILMPLVSIWKLRVAAELGSVSLRAEAKETLACSYLSATLLVGLAANAVLGWWWADPVAALLMVPWLIMEGREGLSDEECCD